jgi:glycosyltransferase involved in cell wall biosynthesis
MIKNIVWLQDCSSDEQVGGSEITSDAAYNHGKNLGFNAVIMTVSRTKILNMDLDLVLEWGDWFVLNNIKYWMERYPGFLTRIIETKSFIRWEHDYLWDHGWPLELIKQIFTTSKMNVFMSPLHMREHIHRIPEIGAHPKNITMPSFVELKLFKPVDGVVRKPNSVIYAGRTVGHKGFNNVIDHARNNPSLSYDVYNLDNVLYDNLPANITIKGAVVHTELPAIYSSYEHCIHLPNWTEPAGRSVVEATLCGCKCILNDNVGIKSYPWFTQNIDKLRTALQIQTALFWFEMCRVMHWGNVECHVPF